MQSDVDLVKTVADLRELGATSVRVEVTRGGTLRVEVAFSDGAPWRHEWKAR